MRTDIVKRAELLSEAGLRSAIRSAHARLAALRRRESGRESAFGPPPPPKLIHARLLSRRGEYHVLARGAGTARLLLRKLRWVMGGTGT